MQSILEVDPKIDGIPKRPLKFAVDHLLEVALAETKAETERLSRNFRTKYYSALSPPGTKGLLNTIDIECFKQKVTNKIISEYGRNFGPIQNAFAELDTFSKRAMKAGYPLASEKLQKALMYFLLAYVTEGFEGGDTTGTQMGNFAGKWHGGGF
ncbi:MAG TPA: hypothetical protein VJA19_11360 [Pseudomonas sp.]|nr:hypothetical protein [Pseudomonas sp.]